MTILRFLRALLLLVILLAVVVFTAITIDERLSAQLDSVDKTFEEVRK